MKREELRKVEFKHTIDGGYTYETYSGYFHIWGLESMNFVDEKEKDYAISYTIGIIEQEDGNVTTVNPEFIKFL